jgi:peptidoglycan L-alanyl-D-glutamate endopeptidase CwlK
VKFFLGPRSLTRLINVHPDLVAVVTRAIQLSAVDFAVHDGVRTVERQAELVKAGASKTMKGMHLIQADGYGHAVDLVPYIDGQMRWEWGPIYHIAEAMGKAAAEQQVVLRWGGVWDKLLPSYAGDHTAMAKAVAEYCARHPGPDFIDGPHFELPH